MNKFRYSIEQDRSDGSWTVVRRMRYGWSVVFRCDDASDAHKWVQGMLFADAQA